MRTGQPCAGTGLHRGHLTGCRVPLRPSGYPGWNQLFYSVLHSWHLALSWRAAWTWPATMSWLSCQSFFSPVCGDP